MSLRLFLGILVTFCNRITVVQGTGQRGTRIAGSQRGPDGQHGFSAELCARFLNGFRCHTLEQL
jgi:hypothetical protein